MDENRAALIIQKRVRRHLAKKKVDENQNNLNENDVLKARKVLQEVNLFYRKLQSNLKRKNEMKKLCMEIDQISEKLKPIMKLEQCKEVETSFSHDTKSFEESIKLHNADIKKKNLKWWEKLDIYEESIL